jgi:moderate conductance mechanosensitive channel
VGPTIIASLTILALVPALDWVLRAIVCALLRIPGPYAGRAALPVVAAPSATTAAALRDAAWTESAVPQASNDAAAAAAEQARAVERHRAARRAYHDVLIKNLRIVLAVVVAALLADIWDLDLQAVAAAKVGATLAGSVFDIIVTLILASAFWGIIKVAIRSAVPEAEAADGETEAGEIGGKGKSRLETLVPLLGKFLLVALVVIVGLIILSELGVDIGPLIAGAGVIGLAIGFGAQTLVRDIISGLFFLLDDAFRVGEYVVVGSVRGMVEHISIRSLRLRHHNGPLHTIPFGEIQTLTNFSRDWAIMKLELRIPFDADLEKVRKLIKKVGQELMDDPVHGPNFMQPLKSQGVNRMDDSAFIVRVKFMARPGEQFVLRREVFRRIQEAFAANGIRFAPRRVIVDTGSAPITPAAIAAAAAAAAAEPADASDKAPDYGDHGM